MATKQDISQNLLPEHFFHIYNRGINGQVIFFTEENYRYFLQKYAEKTKAYIDTYAYCLIFNHFHILVRIKSAEEIFAAAQEDYTVIPKPLQKELAINGFSGTTEDFQSMIFLANHPDTEVRNYVAAWLVSNQLRRLFLGYVKAVNKSQNRHGSLLQKPFKRKSVAGEVHLRNLIGYIHRNPLHHKIQENFREYPHSSYSSHLSLKSTLLKRSEVLNYFDGRSGFIAFHEEGARNWKERQKYVIE